MKEAKAFSPCHITGLFQILDTSADPLRIGSKGAGVSLSRGVETRVVVEQALKDCLKIRINGFQQNSAEVSRRVVNLELSTLEKRDCYGIDVEHRVSVPIGAGLGTSGAGALSLALALNEALGLNMTRIEAAQIAHVAEVECKTGLGTVIAEAFGGVEIRTKEGAPGVGDIIQLSATRNTVVACLIFGPMSTRESLANPITREHVNRFGGDLIHKLMEKPDLAGFLKYSRQFAEAVGLITDRVRRVLDATDAAGFVCSMPMFGEGVFTLVERDLTDNLLRAYPKSPVARYVIHAHARCSMAR